MKHLILIGFALLSPMTQAAASPDPNVMGFFTAADTAVAPAGKGRGKPRYTKTARPDYNHSSATIARPRGYVRGRLTCAINVNRALAQRGVRGTGSAMAKSFLSWGSRSAHPVPGGVAVYNRGGSRGHVAVVASADGMCWNPSSSRQDWRLTPCRRGNFIGYRVG
jgi:hypothetical protein